LETLVSLAVEVDAGLTEWVDLADSLTHLRQFGPTGRAVFVDFS
jgi:hypothetical protein